MEPIINPSLWNNYEVRCFEDSLAYADITNIGGVSPYYYICINSLGDTVHQANSSMIDSLTADSYSFYVIDALGCTYTESIVYDQPSLIQHNFIPTHVTCTGWSNGSLIDSVYGGVGGSINTYLYLWDNGETGLFIDSLSAGIYNVVVTDTNGCVVNTAAIVTQPEEIATDFFFDVSTGCVPLTVNFTNNSQGNPLSCVWDFGNGDTLVGCGSVSYTFNVEGCYDVSLTTLANTGCYGTMTMDSAICVMPNPIASFTSTTANIDYYTGQIIFMNNSIGAQEYIWFFGDGSPNSNAVNPAHNYPQELESTYDVTLIAIDTVYGLSLIHISEPTRPY